MTNNWKIKALADATTVVETFDIVYLDGEWIVEMHCEDARGVSIRLEFTENEVRTLYNISKVDDFFANIRLKIFAKKCDQLALQAEDQLVEKILSK